MTNTIPERFGKNGYELKLEKRSDKCAIYSLSMSWGVVGYEVHKIRRREERQTPYGKVEAGEYLASNEEFGTYAWAYSNKEAAEKKYEEITKE